MLRRALLTWFHRSARDLPWRRTSDPYRIWLSEVLLQQTRVETVIPYYQRFIAAFPTLDALASAPLDRVLTCWAGLGYYRRARNLHHAAQTIRDRHDGAIPRRPDALSELPGCGRYTAAAVASIAFDEPAAALDGNIKRVIARLVGVEEVIDEPRTDERLWRIADELLARRRPGDHNQALMELGATVCVVRNPRCQSCPVRRWCRARRSGSQDRLPLRRKRSRPLLIESVAAAIRKNGRLLMVKRPSTGLLAGMWQLPGAPLQDSANRTGVLRRDLCDRLGLTIRVTEPCGYVQHGFTHRTAKVHVYRAEIVLGRVRAAESEPARWLTRGQRSRIAIARLDRKVLGLLGEE